MRDCGCDCGVPFPTHPPFSPPPLSQIWDDTSLYTPPPGTPEPTDNPWEEDAPVIAQLQHEVAQLLASSSSSSSASTRGNPGGPPSDDDDKEDAEEAAAVGSRAKKRSHPADAATAPVAGAAAAAGGATAATAATAVAQPRNGNGTGAAIPRPLLRKALRRVRVGAALLLHAAALCLAAVAGGPKRRLLAVGRVLGSLLRAIIASLALLGTTCSTLLRRLLAPPARALPRPDLFQRLTTTFTRFLHENYPWLLSHPILYGRPFPWQWKGWKPQPPPSLALGPTIPGLPTLSALLRDLGDVVTPHSLVRRRRRRRQEQQEGEQERYRHHAPHWTLPQQVRGWMVGPLAPRGAHTH